MSKVPAVLRQLRAGRAQATEVNGGKGCSRPVLGPGVQLGVVWTAWASWS